MPFVMMCGTPCSGKTSRVKELQDYLKSHFSEREVVVTGDWECEIGSEKNVVYAGTMILFKTNREKGAKC